MGERGGRRRECEEEAAHLLHSELLAGLSADERLQPATQTTTHQQHSVFRVPPLQEMPACQLNHVRNLSSENERLYNYSCILE